MLLSSHWRAARALAPVRVSPHHTHRWPAWTFLLIAGDLIEVGGHRLRQLKCCYHIDTVILLPCIFVLIECGNSLWNSSSSTSDELVEVVESDKHTGNSYFSKLRASREAKLKIYLYAVYAFAETSAPPSTTKTSSRVGGTIDNR